MVSVLSETFGDWAHWLGMLPVSTSGGVNCDLVAPDDFEWPDACRVNVCKYSVPGLGFYTRSGVVSVCTEVDAVRCVSSVVHLDVDWRCSVGVLACLDSCTSNGSASPLAVPGLYGQFVCARLVRMLMLREWLFGLWLLLRVHLLLLLLLCRLLVFRSDSLLRTVVMIILTLLVRGLLVAYLLLLVFLVWL